MALIILGILLAQAHCDESCLKLWFDDKFKAYELAPAEVQSEFILRSASQERDQVRLSYLFERLGTLADQVPEIAPVIGIYPYTDSIAGEASRATTLGFTRMDIKMRAIAIQASLDAKKASELWMEYLAPIPGVSQYSRGETFSYRPYYKTALSIYDQLLTQSGPAAANLFLAKVMTNIRTQEGLGDFHEALTPRMEGGKLSSGFLSLYKQSLRSMQPETLPQMVNWVRIGFFWRLLLETEEAADRTGLLEAIEAYIKKSDEAPALGYRIAVNTGEVVRVWGGYWPTEALQRWEELIRKIEFTKAEKEILSRIRILFEKGSNRTEQASKKIETVKYWARPKSRTLFEKSVALQRSYSELFAQGAWEAKLGDLMEDVKHHSTERPTEDERLLDFFERWRTMQMFFSMSDYSAGQQITPEKADLIAKQLAARRPHFAKKQLMDMMLSQLESEEGRWVYGKRRVLWLGALEGLQREILQAQSALFQDFQARAGISSHEVIRVYALLP